MNDRRVVNQKCVGAFFWWSESFEWWSSSSWAPKEWRLGLKVCLFFWKTDRLLLSLTAPARVLISYGCGQCSYFFKKFTATVFSKNERCPEFGIEFIFCGSKIWYGLFVSTRQVLLPMTRWSRPCFLSSSCWPWYSSLWPCCRTTRPASIKSNHRNTSAVWWRTNQLRIVKRTKPGRKVRLVIKFIIWKSQKMLAFDFETWRQVRVMWLTAITWCLHNTQCTDVWSHGTIFTNWVHHPLLLRREWLIFSQYETSPELSATFLSSICYFWMTPWVLLQFSYRHNKICLKSR